MAILSKVQKGQPITADLFNNMIDAIRECQLNSVVGSGGTVATFKRGPGGTTISINSQNQQGTQQENICPFTPIASPSTTVTGEYEVRFQAGTINGVLPTNMLEPITGVTTAANTYFYLKCTTDGKVIISSILESDTSLRTPDQPTADTAPTEFNIMVGYMTTAGITERTISCGHLQARIAPSLQEDADDYVAGERNYTQFYNWVF
jgi:hypothetical protein